MKVKSNFFKRNKKTAPIMVVEAESVIEWSLHSSIKTLPYEDFISIITNDDYSPLIISGKPSIDQLVISWQTICDQYGEAIKTPLSESIFDCYKKIIKTKATIHVIDASLLYLANEYDEEIAKMVSEMGYRLITFTEDREQYLKMVEFVRTQAKTLIILLNRYNNEYKMLSPEGSHEARQYSDYINELVILSKHQGYSLKPKEITVLEYCCIVNSFITHQEALQKIQNQYGNATV